MIGKIFALLMLVVPGAVHAGDLPPADATQAVNALISSLDSYFDPAIANKVQVLLRERLPAYVATGDREAFAEMISADLLRTSGDQHLKVSVETSSAKVAEMTPQEEALLEDRLAHGLMAIRRLPANIGYLKLRYFGSDENSVAVIDSAMRLLKDTDALIIDLRENTGGGGAADERLLGHLSATPIPMTVIHWRQPDGSFKDVQRKVSLAPGGPLFPRKPIFVLTSQRTFSAAEGFAYDLKVSGRATLVGEHTRGGANPENRAVMLGFGLRAVVPNGYVEHPTTHGNWNGGGVLPDVSVPTDQALTEAYRLALAAAKPEVNTPKSSKERADAIANPKATLLADQAL